MEKLEDQQLQELNNLGTKVEKKLNDDQEKSIKQEDNGNIKQVQMQKSHQNEQGDNDGQYLEQQIEEENFQIQNMQEDFEFEQQCQIMRQVSQRMSMQEQIDYKVSIQNDKDKKGKIQMDIEQQIKQLDIDIILKEKLLSNVRSIIRILKLIQETMINQSGDETVLERFQKITVTITIFHQQFQQLVHILQTKNNENQNEELKVLSKRYDYLGTMKIKINSLDQINDKMMSYISDNIQSYLNDFKEICKEFNKGKDICDEKNHHSTWNDLKIVHSKLYTIIETIPAALILEKDDLFSLEQNDGTWLELKKYIEVKEIGEEEKIKKSVRKLKEMILLGNAMVSKGFKQKSEFKKQFYTNMSAIYYFFNSKISNRRAEIFLAEPNQQQAFTVWNMLDHGIGKQAMRIAFPNLKYYKKFYIDRLFTQITAEQIQREIEENSINKINQNFKEIQEKYIDDFDMYQKEKLFKYHGGTGYPSDIVQIRFLLHEEPYRLSEEQIKLLQEEKEKGTEKKEQGFFKSIFSKEQKLYEEIIIQIHGGGFVAMTSRTHQTYTRKWAKWLKIPIFCIDYRKAPKYPYPSALDDCWQAYNWILKYIQKFFNVQPKKVVLVGDSAGGNLVAALTARCIKHQIKVPDGIMLIYPALNLNLERFTPSHLISLSDVILSHKLLKLCSDAYSKQNGEIKLRPDIDPFLSPSYISDEILSKFPPVRMVVGTEDPLHDDCYRLLNRLIGLSINSKMTVYKHVPHGFMNFDAMMDEASQCIQDVCNYLSELLNMEKK